MPNACCRSIHRSSRRRSPGRSSAMPRGRPDAGRRPNGRSKAWTRPARLPATTPGWAMTSRRGFSSGRSRGRCRARARRMIPAVSSRALLTALDHQHPEWRSWLAVIEEVMREAQRPQWTRLVPALGHSGSGGRPLLDGVVIGVAPGVIGRWVLRILRRAAAAGMDVRPLATGVAARRIDPLALFGAAVSQDALRLDAFATVEGDDH